MTKAIRVYNGLFGPHPSQPALRMGDLIAVCNFLEWIRSQHTHDDLAKLQMCLPDEVIFPDYHCVKMRDWLIKNTDYVTKYSLPEDLIELPVLQGTDQTYPSMYNIWNIREDVLTPKQNVFTIPDAVKLPNLFQKQKTVVIHPLLDAPYNTNRNWSIELYNNLVDSYNRKCMNGEFDQIIIISKSRQLAFTEKFVTESYDFETNLRHVQEASVFIGGDTGFSHLAASLVNGPECIFYYPHDTFGTTNPFYWKTKHKMIYY